MNNTKNVSILFLRPKVVDLFLLIDGNIYTSNLAKRVDLTYSHAIKVIKKMRDHGLLDLFRDGRVQRIELTKKGLKLQNQFYSLRKVIKEFKNSEVEDDN